MFRVSAINCAIFASAMAAWAGYSVHFQTAPSAPALVIDNPERALGELAVGDHPVTITVKNQSDHLVEIVGSLGGCGSGCCLRTLDQCRRTLTPGETIKFVAVLEVRAPGPFVFEDKLYLNDSGELRSVQVNLSGAGVPAEKPNAPPP